MSGNVWTVIGSGLRLASLLDTEDPWVGFKYFS